MAAHEIHHRAATVPGVDMRWSGLTGVLDRIDGLR
jgi:hypothetical protein